MGTSRTLMVALSLALWLSLVPAQAQQAPPRAKVVSPHGHLNMACENCHTYTSWRPLRAIPEFNHDKTHYALRGMHVNVSCKQCHSSLVFSNVGSKCADCHADIHRRQFGANCESCHTVKGWKVNLQAIQDHKNRFPLVGAHATLQCEDCHTNAASGKFVGLSTDCYSCHAKQYATPNFDHRAMNFPPTCQTCHSMDTWFGAKFDHLKFAGFALTGMHATLECTACHIGGKFAGTPATCFGCHSKDYNGTTNPNHPQAGFPQDCAMCHSTATWLNASFDHAKYANYPLSGKHASVPCLSCHVGGKFVGTSAQCSGCHMTDYNGTTNPNHKTAGFPTDCSICHSTAGWTPAAFDHNKTNFPLTGFHSTLACVACHKNGQFTAMPTTCVSCHLNDYNGTTNPNHKTTGLPTTCEVCHSTSAWMPASFDHSKTTFPLTGSHKTITCDTCHKGKYDGSLPTDCYSCHKADYTGTNNPNHPAAMFPTTCATCHTTVTWLGAVFNHTWFPIYSGSHAGRWTSCGDCHTNLSNFAVFSCITCHTHSQANTDGNHRGVRGYSYGPTTCYSCHPSGNGGG